eukprot:GFYU01005438.1.p1 GENE.GFYU01005438.1~~GFYU01005438.1.p1  ORF type:complete len:717 (-),score=96.43 GFYU01005438.1:195-2225(-)
MGDYVDDEGAYNGQPGLITPQTSEARRLSSQAVVIPRTESPRMLSKVTSERQMKQSNLHIASFTAGRPDRTLDTLGIDEVDEYTHSDYFSPPSPLTTSSLHLPRTSAEYRRRLLPPYVAGYLGKRRKPGREPEWRSRFFVLDGSFLSWYATEEDSKNEDDDTTLGRFPLNLIRRVRFGNAEAPGLFRIEAGYGQQQKVLQLLAEVEEDVHKWLLAFHKCIAAIIDRILTTPSNLPSPDKKWWKRFGKPPRLDLTQESSESDYSDSDVEQLDEFEKSGDDILTADCMSCPPKTNRMKRLMSMDMPMSPPVQQSWLSDAVNVSSKLSRQDSMDESREELMMHEFDESFTMPHAPLAFVCAKQGPRSRMEDAYTVLNCMSPHLQTTGYYAVYDGHGGPKCAEFARDNLHKIIASDVQSYKEDPQAAVTKGFSAADEEFLTSTKESDEYSGTTASVCIVNDSKVLCCNLGDSRAVLSTKGVAKDLSIDQKPGREDEKARILAAGGYITTETELCMSRLHTMDLGDSEIRENAVEIVKPQVTHRINGELSVSRALGDRDYKGEDKNCYSRPPLDPKLRAQLNLPDPEPRYLTFTEDLVLNVPEFMEHEISNDDDFIIIASDGLWEVVESQVAVNFVKKKLQAEDMHHQQITNALADLALKMGTVDNVTVILLFFNDAKSRR